MTQETGDHSLLSRPRLAEKVEKPQVSPYMGALAFTKNFNIGLSVGDGHAKRLMHQSLIHAVRLRRYSVKMDSNHTLHLARSSRIKSSRLLSQIRKGQVTSSIFENGKDG